MVSVVYTAISLVLALISLLTLIFGYIKNLNKIKDGMKAMLRSEIEHCYYENLPYKTLQEYERKNLDSLYAAYHDGLKGNTFAQDLYDEMRDWEIVR